MSKIAFVGDLHGRFEIVEKVLKNFDNIVFIGDYLDSYDRIIGDQLRTLGLVLDAAKERENVHALLGNHEMSYAFYHMRASGWKPATSIALDNYDLGVLQPYFLVGDNILVSHAGISQHLLDHTKQTWQEYLAAEKYDQIGHARGGNSAVGGLYWCDWFREFEPVPGLTQIVGHSGYRPEGVEKSILERDGNWNIDCFQYTNEILILEDETFSVINLDDRR